MNASPPPPEPSRPPFDARRLAWAGAAGLIGGTAVGLLFGLAGSSGGVAGLVAGAVAIGLVQLVYARWKPRA